MTATKNQFQGTANVCAHTVKFRYWDFHTELTPELEAELTEHAEERAMECIIQGCVQGQLNAYHCVPGAEVGSEAAQEEEIQGWWEIA